MDNRLIARIARQGGGKLLDAAVTRLFPEKPKEEEEEEQKKKDATRAITGAIAGVALTRVASRSVPGAIVIGGGILAKKLYDRRKARLAEASAPSEELSGAPEADENGDDEA